MERRVVDRKVDVETREDRTKTVTGYAAVYYREGESGTEYRLWGDTYERIAPGAFDVALREDDVRALFNHDPNVVLGRNGAGTLRLSSDATGLRYEIDMPDTQAAQDVALSISRGDISGSSFAFQVQDESWTRDGSREIRELRTLRRLKNSRRPAGAREARKKRPSQAENATQAASVDNQRRLA